MLIDQLKSDVTASMKAGETVRTSVLRMVLSELNYKKIEVQRDLTDEDVLAVLQREVKKRNEAIAGWEAAGRMEDKAAEEKELAVLKVYLPKMLSEDEVRLEIAKLKELEGLKDFGQAMRIASPVFKGKADGKMVATLVKAYVERNG